MKKKIALMMALLMLALSACGQVVPVTEETPPPTPSASATPAPEVTPTPVPAPTPTPTAEPSPEPTVEPSPAQTPEPLTDAEWWALNMPVMDGSTSLIPLEAGIRSALLEISTEEAEKQVVHTTTYGSFNNLINKTADLIFSVPLSKSQLEQAANSGIELEQVPIAREGFVFVVNADNPVDSLTQEQLRGIYSGKITNWSELGGPDLPIIAYQRNFNSGSQNYMIDFMGNVPLTDAPSELRPGSMSLVVDVVAVNDYAEQSIGYSVYSYAADMYANIDKIKFIAVDGVAPNKETMASGEYPLLSDNYAIFRADEPVDSPVRKLCSWLTSDEGQLAIAEAGYVTVRDIGVDYSQPEPPAAYSAVGSGPADWDASLFECVALSGNEQNLPLNIELPEDAKLSGSAGFLGEFTTGIEYSLSCLTNDVLEAEINAWLANAVDEADESSAEFFEFLEKKNSGQSRGNYSQYYVQLNNREVYFPSAFVRVTAYNGYICATVSQIYTYAWDLSYYYHTSCRIWDMYTGEVTSIANLFREGTDVDEYLNSLVRGASQRAIDSYGTLPAMKRDFVYLPESGWAMSLDGIYIDADNPYFDEGIRFPLGNYNALASEIYRDMSGMFDESVSCVTGLNNMSYLPNYTYVNDNFFSVALLDESVGNHEVRAKINADVLHRAEALTIEAASEFLIQNGMEEHGNSEDTIRSSAGYYGWGLSEYGDRLAVFRASAIYLYNNGSACVWPESEICLLYDLQSGELLDWQELLVDNWQELGTIKHYSGSGEFDGDLEALPPLSIFNSYYYGEDLSLSINIYLLDPATNDAYSIKLPVTALKWFSENS